MAGNAFPMRILVAPDGSGPLDTAIELAGDLAARTRPDLHVLSDARLERIEAEDRERPDAEEARA